MPTVLDIAGLPAPAGIDGASIMPLVRGGEMAARDYIHGEHCFLGMSMHFIVQRDFKYIWMSDTGREQLFDMANDPQELRDLVRAGTHQAKLAELRGVLVRELAGCEEGYSDGVRLVAGRRPTTTLSHARDVR
jgi:arylsulfatase A-like enzyme